MVSASKRKANIELAGLKSQLAENRKRVCREVGRKTCNVRRVMKFPTAMTKDNFCECNLNGRQKSVIYYWQTFLPPCWTRLRKALRLLIAIAHDPTQNSRRW